MTFYIFIKMPQNATKLKLCHLYIFLKYNIKYHSFINDSIMSYNTYNATIEWMDLMWHLI
jgi:hypothetical protein